ncbi:hypothetical protein C6Q15_28500 [Burkholderia multivorans]|uniref:Acyltransferase 3 domain-containing protein n=1 Tax=Burkholderia multivorans TaxID=87883 RepID=A0A2S9MBH2_9BURK|nr:acyltransferase [Burkholderia multivorans]MBU9536987.1 acyltransferase [Burkholderia multivorans]MBU9635414.1 acyltransferase [Burkholderia multivorans]PRF08670.1 hypothetical protein C6Q07_11290 [Burkholderia multivorans]PRF54700.1 hypothetical protein C6Q15_28500 [Burkholderia multivorans]
MKHIRGIDGLRAIAILCVLTEHTFLNYFSYIWGFSGNSIGGVGVSIFFVISGFLITSILLRERDSGESSGVLFARFYLRRALRIFPIYYIVIAAGSLLGWQWFREISGWHLLYLTNFYVALHDHWIGFAGHFWSLAVEEQFYLIWPAILFFTPRRHALPIIVSFILIGAISGPLMAVYGASELQTYVLPFPHFDELGLGALLAYATTYHRELVERARPTAWQLFAFLVVAVAFYYGLNYKSYSPLGDYVNRHMFDALAAACILVCVSDRGTLALVRLLELWPLKQLGKISYGVYLYHNLIPLIYQNTRFSNENAHSVFGFFVYLGTTIGMAVVSWHLIEKPILSLKPKIDLLVASFRPRQLPHTE